MTKILNPISGALVTSSTVADAVGICYFDPISEQLLELSSAYNHFVSVEPQKAILKKYYAVVAPTGVVSYIKISIPKAGLEEHFSVKTIISVDEPSLENFELLPDFNSFRFINPTPGAFTPIWLLVKSKTPINEILPISLELEYE